MLNLSQATKGKKVFHVISLHEQAEKVIITGVKLVHNETRFYIEYKTQEGTTKTDINTSFANKKPMIYN